MINEHRLAIDITKKEGGKKAISIGQVKEVLKIALELLGEHKGSEILQLIEKHS